MLFRGLSAFWRRGDWPQLNRSQLSGFRTVCVSYGPHGDSTFISFLHPKAGKRELSITRHAKAAEMRPIVKVSFLIHAVALLTTGSWELKGSQETMRSIVLCLWSFFIFLCRSFLGFTQSAYNRNKVMKVPFSPLQKHSFREFSQLSLHLRRTWRVEWQWRVWKFFRKNDGRLSWLTALGFELFSSCFSVFLWKEKKIFERRFWCSRLRFSIFHRVH